MGICFESFSRHLKQMQAALLFPFIVVVCQSYYADKNPLFYFKTQEQVLINSSISKFMNYDNKIMWEPVNSVSEKAPFIFFHQRKAGGTSIRSTLHQAALSMNVSDYIPCFTGKCFDYHIPTNQSFAIYGGHFQWSEGANINHASSSSVSKFSCMTNLREPISRIVSCIYFRFGYLFRNEKVTCIAQLSNASFLSSLNHKLDSYGNSCINEPFRAMSGADDEMLINSLGIGSNIENKEKPFYPRLKAESAKYLESTFKNIQKCVPHILELHSDNDILFDHKFPKMAKHNAFKDITVLPTSAVSNDAICDAPSAYQQHLLENVAAYESVLYNAVLAKVQSALVQLKKQQLRGGGSSSGGMKVQNNKTMVYNESTRWVDK